MKFSIIIPFYNVEKYIEECIQSIASQKFPTDEFEIIAVDDCSGDESTEIVKKLIIKYPNLHLIYHKINKRQGGARNTGIKAAKGDWIFFVDSDDCWANDHILKDFQKLIDDNKAAQVIKSIKYGSIGSFCSPLKILNKTTGIDLLCSNDYLVNIWNGCYSKKFIIDNNLFFRENVFFEDSDWTLKLVLKAKNILLINYPFYWYRVNPHSTSNGYSFYAFRDNITSAFIIEEIMSNNELKDAAQKKCRDFILGSIMTFIKTSRNYPTETAREQLSRLKGKEILNPHNYDLSKSQKLLFFLLNTNVSVLVNLIKLITKFKRSIKL